MKRYTELVAECLPAITEIFPWDADELLRSDSDPLLVDIREQVEFAAMHIEGAMHVPRGILESAGEYEYEETVRELVEARERNVVVVCRSGNRSAHAAKAATAAGWQHSYNIATGFEGDRDDEGHRGKVAGWKVDGLPWTQT